MRSYPCQRAQVRYSASRERMKTSAGRPRVVSCAVATNSSVTGSQLQRPSSQSIWNWATRASCPSRVRSSLGVVAGCGGQMLLIVTVPLPTLVHEFLPVAGHDLGRNVAFPQIFKLELHRAVRLGRYQEIAIDRRLGKDVGGQRFGEWVPPARTSLRFCQYGVLKTSDITKWEWLAIT